MGYEIITDSAANLPPEYVKKHKIMMMSLKYYIGENEYDSYIEAKNDAWLKKFYDFLREKGMATTSCLNAEYLRSLFTSVLENGRDFIYLAFSSKLSATYDIAADVCAKLKEEYPDRKIYIVDTKSACMGQGLYVDFAVQKREEGYSIEKLYDWCEKHKQNIVQWFTVDDLFFLKRGGRVSAAAALAGTVLGIKPVMHVDSEGRLIPVSKVRGRKQSLTALVDKIEELSIDPANQRIFIAHGDCADDLKFTEKQIRERLGTKDIMTTYLNPIIGSHSGPGTIALFFFGKSRI